MSADKKCYFCGEERELTQVYDTEYYSCEECIEMGAIGCNKECWDEEGCMNCNPAAFAPPEIFNMWMQEYQQNQQNQQNQDDGIYDC